MRTRRGLRLAVGAAATLAAPVAHADALTSTAYCQLGRMADGTYVRDGSAASNALALGTRITITPAFFGRRRFTVRDRIGWGSELDLWVGSCRAAVAWGRRAVTFRVGWPRSRRRRLVALRGRVEVKGWWRTLAPWERPT